MNISRLNMNHMAMDVAFERLKNALAKGEDSKAFISLTELLLWIITTDEWHLAHNKASYQENKGSNIQYLYPLRYPYNASKHNMNFVKFHEIRGGMSFPVVYPMTFKPIKSVWVEVEEFKGEGIQKQKEAYNKYLEGKEVTGTLMDTIKFLDEQKQLLKEGG